MCLGYGVSHSVADHHCRCHWHATTQTWPLFTITARRYPYRWVVNCDETFMLQQLLNKSKNHSMRWVYAQEGQFELLYSIVITELIGWDGQGFTKTGWESNGTSHSYVMKYASLYTRWSFCEGVETIWWMYVQPVHQRRSCLWWRKCHVLGWYYVWSLYATCSPWQVHSTETIFLHPFYKAMLAILAQPSL